MPLGKQELTFLREVLPFWGRLTDAQREAVGQKSVLRHFPAGAPLHSGPNDCAGLYVIRSGQVRSYILSEEGREVTLFRLYERDVCIFSASCIMKNIQFDVYTQAVEDSDAILIPTPVYQELRESSLAVSEYTGQLLSSRFSDVMWLLEQILFMRFDRRLALFLLEHADGNGRLKATHEEIARDMGTAREVVTRMLRYFQSEGMVRLSRGQIALTDLKKLKKTASRIQRRKS